MESTEYRLALVTAPNLTGARKLASAALNGRLAACANLVPKIESHYWWEGKLESSTEVLVLFKTTEEKIGELQSCVLQNHPYDTPEFISFPIGQGNEKYLAWIGASVRPE